MKRFTTLRNASLLFCSLGLLVFGAIGTPGQAPAAQSAQAASVPVARSARVWDKPGPGYTEAARQRGIEGTVKLRITLLATGQVGEIVPLSYLSYGLTDQAIAAAKQIRFEPKRINGVAVDETTTVEYRFRLYFKDEDEVIRTKVAILGRTQPKLTAEEAAKLPERKVAVNVFFGTDGKPVAYGYVTDVPLALRARFSDAVQQIRYRPAVHSSGRRVAVTKVIEYQF
ncbi:MAG: energy transducer TonB [Blastocatellia bacterium]|nr:energy transducer TonB [Blastocatellia bacterium]